MKKLVLLLILAFEMLFSASFDVCGGDSLYKLYQQLDDVCRFNKVACGDGPSISVVKLLVKEEYERLFKICAPNNKNLKLLKESIDKKANDCIMAMEIDCAGKESFNEIMGDINKAFGLIGDTSKDLTTSALSKFGSDIVEGFDEILGAGRILGYDNWVAHPLESLLETIGVMDENKEYIDPYKSKVYNDFFKDSFSFDYVRHKLMAESGRLVGYVIGIALFAALFYGLIGLFAKGLTKKARWDKVLSKG